MCTWFSNIDRCVLYICTYMHIHITIHTHTHTRIYSCANTHTHTHVFIYEQTRPHTRVYIYVQTHAHVHCKWRYINVCKRKIPLTSYQFTTHVLSTIFILNSLQKIGKWRKNIQIIMRWKQRECLQYSCYDNINKNISC